MILPRRALATPDRQPRDDADQTPVPIVEDRPNEPVDSPQPSPHIPRVGEDLRIGINREEDAECVAEALGEYRPEVEHGEGDWAVVIPAQPEGVLVTDLLTALEQCLTENEIRSVRVTIGEQSYVMEGMA